MLIVLFLLVFRCNWSYFQYFFVRLRQISPLRRFPKLVTLTLKKTLGFNAPQFAVEPMLHLPKAKK
jgi:hypothetical protein